MKVAMMIANEMLVSHSDEIKHLSKEALRHEIKLIVDKDWASSDPEQLVSDVEQEIQNLNEEWQEERQKCRIGDIHVSIPSVDTECFENGVKKLTEAIKKMGNERFYGALDYLPVSDSPYSYKFPKPKFTRPVKLDIIN